MDPADPGLDLSNADAVIDVFHAAAEACRRDPKRRGSTIHLGDTGRLLVTGDLHDDMNNFRRIVRFAGLDTASPEDPDLPHLVLHEVIHGEASFNGEDLSVRMLARVAALKARFPEHVHVLLSNHELAQLLGEGIVKQGASVVEAFDDGVEFLYQDRAGEVREAINAYVRAMPLCVRGALGVLVAHSLPAPRAIERFDKGILDRELEMDDLEPRGSAYEMVWGRYQNKKVTEELADAWGVDVFLLGHQPADFGTEPLCDNGIILASDHSHGVLLPVDLSKAVRRNQLMDRVVALAGVPLPPAEG
ncbi:metallophosphoesterase [Phycisphaera mikurensis]|uniref:Calcineurin-like phosphoesterase domain-containing protein n=1 Tax=Phycisphaera mikurensis (strain NBRC 102666 / KCTC 22515 / FYK2301M01) TaxID=1142394 RepID=I0IHA2_PHYMF|nr:metallophosphoesterase [Phycisphaera mikurensis]MBB6440889.1 hypothetical protein [Phycisphaera mikurensis]BAM04640.1 hypothetical protein PSMK_24810 [Phycisphaera mikurensis NBRC 102666]